MLADITSISTSEEGLIGLKDVESRMKRRTKWVKDLLSGALRLVIGEVLSGGSGDDEDHNGSSYSPSCVSDIKDLNYKTLPSMEWSDVVDACLLTDFK